MRLHELLAGAPEGHVDELARELELPDGAGVDEVAERLRDEACLEALVASLPPACRGLAAYLAFGTGRAVVTPALEPAGLATAHELERRGLAFAFDEVWSLGYRLAADLAAPLRRLLAASALSIAPPGEAERFVGAPLQTAHDAAVLWAELRARPARVKADGDLYQRARPILLGALPSFAGVGDEVRETRLELALSLLREHELLRVRNSDLPGAPARRELTASGDPRALLDVPTGALRALLVGHAGDTFITSCLAAAAEVRAGEQLEIHGLGAALATLAEAAGYEVSEGSQAPLAIAGVVPLWLAGALELGLDANECVCAVRFSTPAAPEAGERLGVCQSSFELVTLRPPTPVERLELTLLCEAVDGQEHVMRLTRESAAAAARAGLGAEGALATLERLAGPVPQNVARSVTDWIGGRRTARLRSALFVDAGDRETTDRIAARLGKLVVERLGESLLVVPASELTAVQHALAAAGVQLEPGLDRISGTISESPPAPGRQAEATWTPAPARRESPAARQISTLGAPASDALASLSHLDVIFDEEESFGDPSAAVEDALTSGGDVDVLYHGSSGITRRRLTPLWIESGRLGAYCHLRRAERTFKLDWIVEATPVRVAA